MDAIAGAALDSFPERSAIAEEPVNPRQAFPAVLTDEEMLFDLDGRLRGGRMKRIPLQFLVLWMRGRLAPTDCATGTARPPCDSGQEHPKFSSHESVAVSAADLVSGEYLRGG